MSGYREIHFFSMELDADAVRLSLADDDGREYYAIVLADVVGRGWRERREAALIAIDDAIAAKMPPGKVDLP
jgi:hypothetical protein